MSLLQAFILGVAASLVASYLWKRISSLIANKPISSLDGYWFEVIPASPDRRYSIGKFNYNRSNNSYSFDGINYKNSGEIFCTWKSTSVEVDKEKRQIRYIFKASIKQETYIENYGFGVVGIEENEQGNPVPVDGHYIESKEDASPYTHSMVRLETVAEELGISQGKEDTKTFHSRIVHLYHEKHLERRESQSRELSS